MNRLFALIFCLLVSVVAAADDLPSGSPPGPVSSDVGYKTVAAALAALKLSKDASFSTVQGWTIVTDEAHQTVWSFSPRTDRSYPAVVKRMVVVSGGGSIITMKVLCESDKASCDDLVREFSGTKAPGSAAQPE